MVSRQIVYEAIDSERKYQERRWNPETTSTGGQHSVTEFLVFMRDYIEEALHRVSRNPEPGASEAALHDIRKVTALGVACMEQHGAPHRVQQGGAEVVKPEPECTSCGEQVSKHECAKSKHDCGHHCNCSWVHDQCCWCDQEFARNELRSR